MDKPLFSITAAAIKNHLYKNFYNSLKQDSNVPFEVIFVGDNPPQEKMPSNFRYIETKVKPAQCIEIAVRQSYGKYVLPFSDDMLFSPNFLDRLENYTKRLDTDRVLIGFRYKFENIIRDNFLRIDLSKPHSPVNALSPCFRRDIWMEIGGIDNRFIGSLFDADLSMRCYERGMTVFITPDCIIEEIQPVKGQNKLYAKSRRDAHKLMSALWVKEDGTFSKTRLSSVRPFLDENILIKSQGVNTTIGRGGKHIWP